MHRVIGNAVERIVDLVMSDQLTVRLPSSRGMLDKNVYKSFASHRRESECRLPNPRQVNNSIGLYKDRAVRPLTWDT